METRRTPLATFLATRDDTVDKDGLLTNCFVEQHPQLGEIIVKRPGYSILSSLGFGCAQGSVTFNGGALFVQGDKIWTNFTLFSSGATWTSATAPPKPTSGSLGTARGGYLASLNGNLYMIGGRDNLDTTISVYRSTDNGTTWVNIATPWTTTFMVNGQAAAVFNGRIYVMLSVSSTREIWSSADGISWAKNTSDIAGGGSERPSRLLVHNSLLYAFLSLNGVSSSVWSSADGSVWTSMTGAPAWAGLNQGSFAVYSLDNNLYVAAGDNLAITKDDVWKSTDNGVSWTLIQGTAAFGARSFVNYWTYNNKLWIAGGNLPTSTNDVYNSTDGITWSLVTAGAGWTARGSAACCVHNNTMYIGPGTTISAAVSSLHFAAPGSATNNSLPTPTVSCLRMDLTLIPAFGATPKKAFIKSTRDAWVYDGSTVTKVTDVDYPAVTVPGVVYLDGTIYVMDADGKINGSDLLAPLSWSALNFITANAEADIAVALARQLNYVIAFKEYSTEVFYNAGNATGSPLGKVLNALLEIGCASAGSIAYSDNTIYFMANSRQKGRSIQKMDGYTPKYISNPYIDRILNGDDLANVYAFVVKSAGHFFYVITLKSSSLTLVYDEMTQRWHRWTNTTSLTPATITTAATQTDGTVLVTMPLPHGQADGNPVTIGGANQAEYNGFFPIRYDSVVHSTSQFSYTPTTVPSVTPATGTVTAIFYQEQQFPGVYYSKGVNVDLILDESTGSVYNFDPGVYQDNTEPIDTRARTAIEDFGIMNSKFYRRLELVMDKITAKVGVRFSDDDYQTWSLYRQVQVDLNRAQLRALGSGRRRAYEFRHFDNTPLRAIAAEQDFYVGAF